MTRLFFLLFSASMFLGCSRMTIESDHEMLRWINNEENGFTQSKYANGLKLTVKYLPMEYLVLKELKSSKTYSRKTVDSLIGRYKNSKAFVFTISPDEREESGSDVMYKNVQSLSEFKQRVWDMNFNINQFVKLKSDKSEFEPVLSTMENIYGLGKQRSVYFVFSDNEKSKGLHEATDLDFVYTDEIYNTGISHFIFKKDDLDKLPKVNFLKN